MTPLALELFEDLFGPAGIHIRPTPSVTDEDIKSRRIGRFLDNLLREAKFFEMSAVVPLFGELSRRMFEEYEDHDRLDQRRAYLPAEKSWLEFRAPGLNGVVEDRASLINAQFCLSKKELERVSYWYRAGFVFIGRGTSTGVADRFQIQYETPRPPGPRIWRINRVGPLPLVNSGLRPQRSQLHRNADGQERRFDKSVSSVHDFTHYAMLALINSPRFIGQRGHYPHGRAEREALKRAKMVGKFPLRAWTEILLTVRPIPEDRSGAEPKEMHLTGERCLHFCRTYMRVRLGMLEYIEGHWRGDPALGMKRSRYVVRKEAAE